MIEFKLQKLLTKHNMPRKRLAEMTGIRPDTITAICTGEIKRIPVEGLNKICYTLGCNLTDIMDFTDKEYYVASRSGRSQYGPNTYAECERFIADLISKQDLSAESLIIKQLTN